MGAKLTVLCVLVVNTNALNVVNINKVQRRHRFPTSLSSTTMEKPFVVEEYAHTEQTTKYGIKQHRLLSAAEEIELAKDARLVNKWDSIRMELREELKRSPTEREWAEAAQVDMKTFAARRQACREAKAAFVAANLPLVYSVAKRYRWVKSMGYEDVLQEGIFGLTRAVERFDPDLGYRFSTYAVWWIRQAIAAAILNQSRVIRLPPRLQQQLANLDKARNELEATIGRAPTNAELAAELQIDDKKIAFLRNTQRSTASPVVSFDGPRGGGGGGSKRSGSPHGTTFSSSGTTSSSADISSSSSTRATGLAVADTYADDRYCPLQTAESLEVKEHIRHLLHTALNPTECRVIELRFGLDDGTPHSLAEIASIVDATPNQIRNIKAKALNKLRQPHNGNHILRTLSSAALDSHTSPSQTSRSSSAHPSSVNKPHMSFSSPSAYTAVNTVSNSHLTYF